MSLEDFVRHRSLLFTVAYELLGSAADAEDVVQETWLRWSAVDLAQVADPRAYLVRIVTRLGLNRLRTLSRQREDYIGNWLPEPLLTSPDVADDAELAQSVSLAMMVVLETLTPTERAVFVLHEVFAVPHTEIAAAIDKSPAAVRQIAHRAREHVAARQPRVSVDRHEQERAVDRFMAAIGSGDLASVIDALAPEVIMVADGGGVKAAFRPVVVGAEKVAKVLAVFGRDATGLELLPARLNGSAALVIHTDGRLDTAVGVAVEDGRISALYLIRNPAKLTALADEVPLTR